MDCSSMLDSDDAELDRRATVPSAVVCSGIPFPMGVDDAPDDGRCSLFTSPRARTHPAISTASGARSSSVCSLSYQYILICTDELRRVTIGQLKARYTIIHAHALSCWLLTRTSNAHSRRKARNIRYRCEHPHS
jgi:hypothetical protein